MIIIEIVLALLFLLGLTFVSFEKYEYTFLSTIVLVATSWFLFDPVKTFVTAVGWSTIFLKWVPLYLIVGVGVAFIKWGFHVWKTVTKISNAKESFEKSVPQVDMLVPATRREEFVRHYIRSYGDHRSPDYFSVDSVSAHQWKDENIVAELLTPRAKRHLDRISFWVIEWPYVVITTAFDDIFIKFARNAGRFFDWAFTKASRFWIARIVKGI